MSEFLTQLFGSGPFIPHGHCYLWKTGLVWLHITSDSLIALAYYSIPIALFYFVRKRHDLPYKWIFWLFAAFIVACGTTHLMEVWTLWYPTYWLSGGLKAATALVSVLTAAELFPLVPKALALPSPAQLEQANLALQGQIWERAQAETKLRTYQDQLEELVAARTRELTQANEQLQQEIAERQRTEVALRQSEAQFRQLAETIDEVYWLTSPDATQILYVSPAYERIGGRSCERLYERPDDWLAAVHPEDLPQVMTALQQRVTGTAVLDAEYRFIRSDGAIRWMRIREYPIQDESGQIVRIAGVGQDITEHKQIEKEREDLLARAQAARSEAEQANRIKDEFLAVLSHELRSPLNPILGWSKLLQSGRLDASRTQEAIATIERNARLQSELIEDLLDVSRILQGKLALNVTRVALIPTIESALETVRLAAEAKAIDLQFVVSTPWGDRSPDTPCWTADAPDSFCHVFQSSFFVSGDSARLQQVFWNLFSNAVKFTPEGGRVEVRLEGKDEGGRMRDESGSTRLSTSHSPLPTPFAILTVTDTGKGISPEFLPHVFDYFRQADSTTTRKFGGLGLGLAIVQHILELHGGSVTASSPGEGQGSTFTVRLPLLLTSVEPMNSVNSCTSEPIPVTPLAGMKILLVDDETDNRELMGFVLQEAGAIVLSVSSGTEALQTFTQTMPDVVVSDIGMPGMDGYGLIRRLRGLPPEQGGKVPAIALTAYAGEINQKQALAAGFHDHLAKPVEPDELIQRIVTLLQGRTSDEALNVP